jgi:predicted TIM-barrel fold metal-dependent hydrolase
MTGCGCGCQNRAAISRRGFIAGAASFAAMPWKALAATPFRVDTHHHIFPRAVMDLQERLNPRWGKLETPRGLGPWSPRVMLDDMDRNGVASVVISPAGPGAWFGDASGARQICRAWNEYAAGLARDNAGRVGVFALVALPDIDGALGEIAYALDTLRLDGVAFYTNYDSKYPGEPAFAPVFTELNRRRATVFFHPLACCGAPVPGVPTNAYELPFDTTRAIASLMFSGTFTRNPDIRFIFSHGGGAMPMLAGRIEDLTRSFKPLRDNVPDGVPAQLSRLYVDTAGAFSPAAIAATMKTLPATHVLYGSDFPYSGSAEAIAGLATSGLDTSALRGVERDNALDLFPRLRT